MTDHNHGHDPHGAHGGGHEIDSPPTRELFNIVWGLSLLTLVSLVTCVQLFNNQAKEIGAERGKEGSFVLADYRKDAETRTRGAGQDSLTDATGKVVARYNYIPLASARELILGKPEKLGAFAPPPGWIHPDDVAAGGQGAGAPPPAMPAMPQPTDPAALGGAPVEGQPTGAPVEGQPTGAAATPPNTPPTEAPGTLPGPKDEAMPVNADKGQSESTKPVPGGTPEPVGAKSPGEPAAPEPVKTQPEPAK